MDRFLWITLAGAFGSGARYLVSTWALHRFGTAFPWGTLLVNVVGCFLICLLMELAVHTSLVPPMARFASTTGFLGGLTTYSTFNFETLTLFGKGERKTAAAYFMATLVGGFGAGLVGIVVARVAMR